MLTTCCREIQNKMLFIAPDKKDGTLFILGFILVFLTPSPQPFFCSCCWIYDYKYDDDGLVGAAVSRREWRDGAHRERNVYEIT